MDANEPETTNVNPARPSRRAVIGAIGGAGLAGLAVSTIPAAAARAGTPSTASTAPAASPRGTSGVPLFENFIGTCQAGTSVSDLSSVAGMRWDREDFDWNSYEPSKGTFDNDYLEKLKTLVTTANTAGATVLPILDYTAVWAARRSAYSFTENGIHYSLGPVTAENGSTFTRRVTARDATGKVISDAVQDTNGGTTPPADQADWEAYVETMVSTFTAAPYNVKYFQIWNEAHWDSGFWFGGLDEYFDLIHNPAARIIRKHGGKVVYGGWVCGASLQDFVDLLDRHRSWDLVDVLDVHYDPLFAMDFLVTEARRRGHSALQIWQTEIGFSNDFNYLPNLYSKGFYWALNQGLAKDSDRHKLFWFAWFSPDDPAAYGYNACLHKGSALSNNGVSLNVLTSLIGGPDVRTFNDFSTTPALRPELDERLSAAEGFQVNDKKIVISIQLARQNPANIFYDVNGDGTAMHLGLFNPEVTVTLRQKASQFTKVRRVDILGNSVDLAWDPTYRGPGGRVQVPVQDTDADTVAITSNAEVRTFYLVLES